MDVIDAIINIVFFAIVIFLISRVAHYFNYTKKKLNEIDQKLEEIMETLSKKEV